MNRRSKIVDRKGVGLHIRPLATNDALDLFQFFRSLSPRSRSTFQPHPFTKRFCQKLAQDALASHHLRMVVTLANDPSHIIGYAFLTRIPGLSWFGYFGIAVTDAYQGRGIASQLMKELFRFARTKGVRQVYLNVFSINEAAQRAYHKFGFHPLKTNPLVGKLFTLFELAYNGQLSQLFTPARSNSAHSPSVIWMVKSLA